MRIFQFFFELPLRQFPKLLKSLKSEICVGLAFFFLEINCVGDIFIETTSSYLHLEVKQHWVMLVLGLVTAWEYVML